MSLEMVKDDRVGFPARDRSVGRFTEDSFADGDGVIEEAIDPGACNNDARVTVAGGEHAEPADIEMKRASLGLAAEGMPGDHDVELATLQTVGGVDGDVG